MIKNINKPITPSARNTIEMMFNHVVGLLYLLMMSLIALGSYGVPSLILSNIFSLVVSEAIYDTICEAKFMRIDVTRSIHEVIINHLHCTSSVKVRRVTERANAPDAMAYCILSTYLQLSSRVVSTLRATSKCLS